MLVPLAVRMLGAAATGAVVMALVQPAPAAKAPDAKAAALPEVFKNGEGGFVVDHIAYALSKDASETGACPKGMTGGLPGLTKAIETTPEGKQRPGESTEAWKQRLAAKVSTLPDGKYVCANPELSAPDPTFRTVTGANVPADGIDLDGQDSRPGKRPAPGTCAHADFPGLNGERGIDNQFYRVVGCSKSWQSTGQSNGYEIEMYTGSWGIVLQLKGVDNLQNDNDVEVGIYSNGDPIQLSSTRQALAYATYAVDQDPRFRATAHGRIVNGVLTTDPVDVRFHMIVNSIRLERPIKGARVKLTIAPDGAMDGYLAGYTPVEEMYDLQYGFRNGKDGKGGPANPRLRKISSEGQAFVLGHTCNGAYYALKAAADGMRDPATGHCTAISTQYRIHMIPAFVVDLPTQSINARLDGK